MLQNEFANSNVCSCSPRTRAAIHNSTAIRNWKKSLCLFSIRCLPFLNGSKFRANLDTSLTQLPPPPPSPAHVCHHPAPSSEVRNATPSVMCHHYPWCITPFPPKCHPSTSTAGQHHRFGLCGKKERFLFHPLSSDTAFLPHVCATVWCVFAKGTMWVVSVVCT